MPTPLTRPAVRQVWAALRMLVVMTAVVGLAYPLAMTALAQAFLPGRAGGSVIERHGTAVGSSLVGQSFAGRPEYFQGRPSAAGDGYDPRASSASHLGPENPDLVAVIELRRHAAAALDGTRPDRVAPDALLASGSGLDPHISPEYAAQQVPRIARERGLPEDVVRSLVDRSTDGRALGFLGEAHVNVLTLNLALDNAAEQAD